MNRLLFGLLALAQGVSASAATDETPSPERLPEVLVTATRTEEDPSSLPYSVEVVKPSDMQISMPRTTPEALREIPSVMLQKTSHGQGSPYLRGFTGFRTLMLVDGIRLNNSTFRDGPNQYWGTIDALSLDRLELVRGPSSVLYGSDAIGGTVNALSQGRQFGYVSDWDGRTYYRYASAERSHTGRAEFEGQLDEDFGLHLGGTWKDFGDLEGGSEVGEQPATGYDEWDLDAKLEYRVSERARLVYGHQTVRLDDAWRTHSTLYGVLWSGTTKGTDFQRSFDQARDLDYLQYHAEDLDGFINALHVSISHHYQGEDEDRIDKDRIREIQSVDVHTLGASLQLESPSSVGQWTYGTEYYHDWVDSSYTSYNPVGNVTTSRVQGPVADDASYDLVGVFVQDDIPLVEDRLGLILGARYTHAQLDAEKVLDPNTKLPMSMSDSWDNVVGSARVSYHPDDAQHWTIYSGISQGFRAPNLSDLTRFDIARSGEQEIPAFGLKPETFLSPEVGAKFQNSRFAAEASYFYTFMDELIVRVPTGASTPGGKLIVNKENSGEGYVHGVELAASVVVVPDWTVWGNFTWMEGSLDAPILTGGPMVTEHVSRLMPMTVNAGLTWRPDNGRVFAEFVSTFAARQDKLASNDIRDTQRIPVGGTPGYSVFHVRAGWQVTKQFLVTAAIENLTDEDFRIHGSGVNEPGRNFLIAGDFRF